MLSTPSHIRKLSFWLMGIVLIFSGVAIVHYQCMASQSAHGTGLTSTAGHHDISSGDSSSFGVSGASAEVCVSIALIVLLTSSRKLYAKSRQWRDALVGRDFFVFSRFYLSGALSPVLVLSRIGVSRT
ncbi:MAG: hypothetical protein Q8K86_01970 [Candidatus Nanopelagicaceae bacterium]|nr:hypothetical protein [Candidatus Nanopelagicaceae bacterium]